MLKTSKLLPHPVVVTALFGCGGYLDTHLVITCPHEAEGSERPCAVWANDDGLERLDECTFHQYNDSLMPNEWLLGDVICEAVLIEAGSGDDFHAFIRLEDTP